MIEKNKSLLDRINRMGRIKNKNVFTMKVLKEKKRGS